MNQINSEYYVPTAISDFRNCNVVKLSEQEFRCKRKGIIAAERCKEIREVEKCGDCSHLRQKIERKEYSHKRLISMNPPLPNKKINVSEVIEDKESFSKIKRCSIVCRKKGGKGGLQDCPFFQAGPCGYSIGAINYSNYTKCSCRRIIRYNNQLYGVCDYFNGKPEPVISS